MYAGNTLTQRSFRKQDNNVTVKMDIANMTDGQKNGLCHFSSQHAAIGIVKDGDNRFLEYRNNNHVTKGIQLQSWYVWLRSQWGLDGRSQFYYSLDGDHFMPFGEPYQLIWGYYRGDRLGIYCFNDKGESGFVDVDYFHYY